MFDRPWLNKLVVDVFLGSVELNAELTRRAHTCPLAVRIHLPPGRLAPVHATREET
jgi:hypothetical protein